MRKKAGHSGRFSASRNPGALNNSPIIEAKKAESSGCDEDFACWDRSGEVFASCPCPLLIVDLSELRKHVERLKRDETDIHELLESQKELERCAGFVRVFSANRAALKMFGAKDENELTHRFRTISPTKTGSSIREQVLALASSWQMEFEQEFTFTNFEGKSIRTILKSNPYPKDGKDTAIFSITDITELKLAEEKLKANEASLREFTRNFRGIAYRLSPGEARPREFGGIVKEIAGYPAEDFLSGRVRWSDLIFPRDLNVFKSASDTVLANPDSISDVIYRIISKRGEVKWVNDIRHAIRQENGAIVIQGTIYDITERKRVEERLKESELRYRTISDNLSEGVILTDADGHINYANDHFAAMLGYKVKDMLGEHIFWFMSEKSTPLCRKSLSRCREGQGGEFLADLVRKDGRRVQASVRLSPGIDRHGDFSGAILAVNDLTERLEMERRLGETELYYRTIFNRSSSGIIVLEPKSLAIQDFNDTMCRQLGYSREEFSKLNVADITTAPNEKAIRNRIMGIVKTGRGEFETTQKGKGGMRVRVFVKATVIETEGDLRLLMAFTDITKLREAEKELRLKAQLLDMSGDSVFIMDTDGRILFANEVTWISRGYKREELLSKSIWEIDSPEYAAKFEQRMKYLLKNGEREFETVHLRKDGSKMDIWVKAKAIVLDGKDYIMSVCRDITARKAAESNLRASSNTARTYLDVAEVMLLVLSKDGKVSLLNRKGCRVLGCREKEAIGKDWFSNFIPKSERKGVFKVFRKLMEGKLKNVEYFENRVITKSGQERKIAWHNALLFDSEGRINGAISSGQDITESDGGASKQR